MTILGIDTSLRSTGYGVVETAGTRIPSKRRKNSMLHPSKGQIFDIV